MTSLLFPPLIAQLKQFYGGSSLIKMWNLVFILTLLGSEHLQKYLFSHLPYKLLYFIHNLLVQNRKFHINLFIFRRIWGPCSLPPFSFEKFWRLFYNANFSSTLSSNIHFLTKFFDFYEISDFALVNYMWNMKIYKADEKKIFS